MTGGLPDLRIHDLRHQFASFLINDKRTLYEVQQILGHSSHSVTERYARLSKDSLRAASNSASVKIQEALAGAAYVRYDATSLPQRGVRVSAFGTPPDSTDNKAVIVLVNENAVDVTLTASIFPAGRQLTALTPYRTTQAVTFQQQPPIGVSDRSFSVLLPAKSITTLVN